MAIGVQERKTISVLPAISLSFLTFRRKSHPKRETNKPSPISRKSISFLPSIRKSKSKLKTKPDPDTNLEQHESTLIAPPDHSFPPQLVQFDLPHESHQQRNAELTEAQVSAMREAFDVIQSSPDGRVSPADLGFLIRSLGANPTQSEINLILAQEHLTSSFSFNKFKDVMSRHLRSESEQCEPPLRDLFKLFDPDDTGSVTVSELRNILTCVGERLQPSEFDEWIREIGVGSNGPIRYKELFARLIIA